MEIKNKKLNRVIKLYQKKATCPTCKKKSFNNHNPFCSKKCSDLDLMKWLSDENYINLQS